MIRQFKKIALMSLLVSNCSILFAAECGELACYFSTDCMARCEVTDNSQCEGVPTVSIDTPATQMNVGSEKIVDLQLGGSVGSSDACPVSSAWYELIDEYGELNQEQSISISQSGTYNITVPISATRRGKDKDGRLYQIFVRAENESGVGSSPEFTARVAHDNR